MISYENITTLKLAIAGFGVEGRSTLAWLLRNGAQAENLIIYDQCTVDDIPDGVEVKRIKDFDSIDSGFDFIVRTASLPLSDLPKHTPVTSATKIFLSLCSAPIIGVTGTKGKGTTTTLIHKILTNVGKTSHLVGNIGIAALDLLDNIKPDDIVCFEMSSFQLWDLDQSPQTAVVLMVEPDHLDKHADFDDYVEAKGSIAKHQRADDWLVYHPSNEQSARIASQSAATLKKKFLSNEGANVVDGQLVIDGQAICQAEDFGLLGKHNWENICAAVTATWRYTQDVSAIAEAVKEFTGLPHRLSLMREVDGVRYYDDSFSSAAAASVAASKSVPAPFVMMVGGKDKGTDYSIFGDMPNHHDSHYVLYGENRDKIAAALSDAGFTEYTMVDSSNFVDVFETARQMADKGWSVILSPGSASFDMFTNYKQRAAEFERLVNDL